MNKLITALACTWAFANIGLAQTKGEPLVIDSHNGKPIAKVYVSIYGPVSKKLFLGQDARGILALLPSSSLLFLNPALCVTMTLLLLKKLIMRA